MCLLLLRITKQKTREMMAEVEFMGASESVANLCSRSECVCIYKESGARAAYMSYLQKNVCFVFSPVRYVHQMSTSSRGI